MSENPRPARPVISRRRWIIRGVLAAVTLVWIVVLLVSCGEPAGEPIDDLAFIRSAERVCADSGKKIRATPAPTTGASFEARAADIERVAGELEVMARNLRALAVQSADSATVGRWLDALDAFNAVGHRYAAAVRSGDISRAETVGKQGAEPGAAFNATSRRNDIDNCLLG